MNQLKKGDTIALVACSNGQPIENKERIEKLKELLVSLGLRVIESTCIYASIDVFNGEAKEKAEAFMRCYKDPEVKAVFDVSGGDLANEVLEYLNYEAIKNNPKPVFGYSDLTTVLNAIYAQTGLETTLYQIRNLIGSDGTVQEERFVRSLLQGEEALYDVTYKFLQGEILEGIVVGGNIRCLLKLAGTPYMPDFKDKVLLLESLGGGPAQMNTFLQQYRQMGVFKQINGIILGTFTHMEKEQCEPTVEELVMRIVGDPSLPIVKTTEIGHGQDAKAIRLGKWIKINQERNT